MMVAFDPAYIVGTGGAIGALLRHAVTARIDIDEFPAGTFALNVLGSFALGVVTFASPDNQSLLLLGTGVYGSFMVFSSFSFETVRLWETDERLRAPVNAIGNLAGSRLALLLTWVLISVVP